MTYRVAPLLLLAAVLASFGSGGLYGLKVDGSLLWERDLGEMHPKHGHGEGSSPALHGDIVYVANSYETREMLAIRLRA